MLSQFPTFRALLVCLFLVLPGGRVLADDVILEWNGYLREVMRRDSLRANPGASTRALAMMNGAMFDIFQAFGQTHRPLRVEITAPAGASRRAAAAQAAYRIVSALYPEHQSWIDWAGGYSQHFVPDGAAKTAGVALGESVAAQYLSWRADDGSDGQVPYQPGTAPGQWRPDPTFFPTQQAWGPAWQSVAPFFIQGSDQFPVIAPPALSSAQYAAAFQEIIALGSRDGSSRTADQTQIGLFWAYDRSGMGPPPRLYSRNLSEIATQRGNTEEENARLFALASVAMADAAIAAWDVKFTHNVWRPITAVREAHTDGNAATTAIAGWVPLGCPGDEVFPSFTPPFPSYVSGHASMGEAVFTVLKLFYGEDEMAYTLTSEELPGVTRSYTTLSQAAQENADSRVYLGVHWRFDQTGGQKLGREVAEYVFANALAPLAESFGEFVDRHGLSGDASGDFDGDGCSDFAEYAFSMDPRTRDAAPAGGYEVVDGAGCVVLRYAVQRGRVLSGLQVRPEVSLDLRDWTDGGILDEEDPDKTSGNGVSYRRARVVVPPGGKLFLRLRGQM